MVDIKGKFSGFNPGAIDSSSRTDKWIGDVGSGSPAPGGGGSPGKSFLFIYQNTEERLAEIIKSRLDKQPPEKFSLDVLRSPVGFFFSRDRTAGAAAKEIREEIISGFEFWSDDSGEHFDMFFPGWILNEAEPRFDQRRFIEQKNEIEFLSKWRYSGETDLLLLNFHYDPQTARGKLSFDEVIVLPVEEMIREKRIGSFAALLRLMQDAAKTIPEEDGQSSPVWKMSDKMGIARGKQSLWDALKKLFLNDFAPVYDNARPYAVVNLSKKADE